jgi:hypothetical protein
VKVYIFGGSAEISGGEPINYNSCEVYNTIQRSWKNISPMPRELNDVSCVMLPEDRVLIVGGSASFCEKCEKFKGCFDRPEEYDCHCICVHTYVYSIKTGKIRCVTNVTC